MRSTDVFIGGDCPTQIDQIDRLIRAGHLEVAVPQLAGHMHCTKSAAWQDVVRRLRRDGLVPEANLLEIVCVQPGVLGVIPQLRLVAGIVAIVTFALFVTQMGMIALIPAISVGVFAFEALRARVLIRASPSLMPAQRAVVSDFLDLSTYVAGELQLTKLVTVGCSVLAMLFAAGGIHLGVAQSDTKARMMAAALVLSGLAMLVATLKARAHVRDLEFRRPFPSFRRPVRAPDRSPGAAMALDATVFEDDARWIGLPGARARLEKERLLLPAGAALADGPSVAGLRQVRIPVPTPGRTLLQLTGILAACVLMAAAFPVIPVIVGCSAVAMITILRAAHTSVSVDTEQIRTVGILTSRKIPLSTVQSARTPATASSDGRWGDLRLDLVFLDERTRTIAVAGPASRQSRDLRWARDSRAGRIVVAAELINAARG